MFRTTLIAAVLLLQVTRAAAQCSLDLDSGCYETKPPTVACGMGPEYWGHTATGTEAGISATLGIDKAVVEIGESVGFWFFIENLSDSTLCLNLILDPAHTLFVLPESCTAPSAACVDAAVHISRQGYTGPTGGIELQPGECRRWRGNWDTSEHPAEPGTYSVLSGLFDPLCVDGGGFVLPVAGLRLPLTLAAPTRSDGPTFSVLKATY